MSPWLRWKKQTKNKLHELFQVCFIIFFWVWIWSLWVSTGSGDLLLANMTLQWFPQNGHIPVAKQQYLMTNCQTFCFFLSYHVSALLTFISGMFNKVTRKPQIHNSKWALYGGSLLFIMKSIKTTYLKQLGTEWHCCSHVRLQVLVQNNSASRLTLIGKVAYKKIACFSVEHVCL